MSSQELESEYQPGQLLAESNDEWEQLTDSPDETAPRELFRNQSGEFAIAREDDQGSGYRIKEIFQNYSIHLPRESYPEMLSSRTMPKAWQEDCRHEYERLVENLVVFWLEGRGLNPTVRSFNKGQLKLKFRASKSYSVIKDTNMAELRAVAEIPGESPQAIQDFLQRIKNQDEYTVALHTPTI